MHYRKLGLLFVLGVIAAVLALNLGAGSASAGANSGNHYGQAKDTKNVGPDLNSGKPLKLSQSEARRSRDSRRSVRPRSEACAPGSPSTTSEASST